MTYRRQRLLQTYSLLPLLPRIPRKLRAVKTAGPQFNRRIAGSVHCQFDPTFLCKAAGAGTAYPS